ncbi:MAG TPA: DUF4040 domain-containing protein [Steroidobacteraceae bacterium]
MIALLVLMFLLVAGTGAGVVLAREPRRQVLALAVNGVALALLFVVLRAPDVAYSEIAVGTALVPLMFLSVLVSLKTDRPEP